MNMVKPHRKIVVLTLPRTGTRSLTVALNMLGLRAFHNPKEFWAELVTSHQPFSKGWDALVCFGWFNVIQLAARYPEILFLYAKRDLDSWLESWEWSIRDSDETDKRFTFIRDLDEPTGFNQLFPNQIVFDKEYWTTVYTSHELYIKTMKVQYDIRCYNLTWESLCGIIGSDIPTTPFPHIVGKARREHKDSYQKDSHEIQTHPTAEG